MTTPRPKAKATIPPTAQAKAAATVTSKMTSKTTRYRDAVLTLPADRAGRKNSIKVRHNVPLDGTGIRVTLTRGKDPGRSHYYSSPSSLALSLSVDDVQALMEMLAEVLTG